MARRNAKPESQPRGLFGTVLSAMTRVDKPDQLLVANTKQKEVYSYKENGRNNTITNVDKTGRRERRRTDMGGYIFNPDKGERPLTERDLPMPGPADYLPNYKQRSSVTKLPEYSIRPRTLTENTRGKIPGPQYQTSKGLMLKKPQQISMKGRRGELPSSSFTGGDVGPGPGKYNVLINTTGSQQEHTKTTIKSRPNTKHTAGLQSTLDLPTESTGFVNAEELFLVDKTEKSAQFGDSPKWSIAARYDVTGGYNNPAVGPANYSRPANYQRHPEPGKSMLGKRLHQIEREDKQTPSAGEYLVPMSDKERAPRALVIPRREQPLGKDAPAPNEYFVSGQYDKVKRCYDGRGPNITFRDHKAGQADIEKLPGPSDYHRYDNPAIPGGKFAREDSRHSIVYPDCLMDKSSMKITKRIPGANVYNPQNHCIGKNSAAKFSFGKPPRTKTMKETVGPGDFNIRDMTAKGRVSGPEYSLGGLDALPKDLNVGKIPVPGAYDATPLPAGKAFTMAGRNRTPNKCTRKPKRAVKAPGPKYNLRDITRTGPLCSGGVQMRGRWSPHIYSGMEQGPKLKQDCIPRRWTGNIHLG